MPANHFLSFILLWPGISHSRDPNCLRVPAVLSKLLPRQLSLSSLFSRLVAETGAATAIGFSAILSVCKHLWPISTASNLRARVTASLTDFGISFKSCTWIEEDETPWLQIRTSRCSSDQPGKALLVNIRNSPMYSTRDSSRCCTRA